MDAAVLFYIKDSEQPFNQTDKQMGEALNINPVAIPTILAKLRKLIYLELIYSEDSKRILQYVPLPNDSEQKDIPGYIYIMQDTALPKWIKIGFSKQPKHREGTLSAQKPTIQLVRKFIGSMEQEKACHRYLSRFRGRGEWFEITVEEAEKAIKKIIGIH